MIMKTKAKFISEQNERGYALYMFLSRCLFIISCISFTLLMRPFDTVLCVAVVGTSLLLLLSLFARTLAFRQKDKLPLKLFLYTLSSAIEVGMIILLNIWKRDSYFHFFILMMPLLGMQLSIPMLSLRLASLISHALMNAPNNHMIAHLFISHLDLVVHVLFPGVLDFGRDAKKTDCSTKVLPKIHINENGETTNLRTKYEGNKRILSQSTSTIKHFHRQSDEEIPERSQLSEGSLPVDNRSIHQAIGRFLFEVTEDLVIVTNEKLQINCSNLRDIPAELRGYFTDVIDLQPKSRLSLSFLDLFSREERKVTLQPDSWPSLQELNRALLHLNAEDQGISEQLGWISECIMKSKSTGNDMSMNGSLILGKTQYNNAVRSE